MIVGSKPQASIRDYIQEADRPEDLLIKHADMPGGPNWLISTRVKRLDSIIRMLENNAYAAEIKIFGSAANEPDKIPNDIDAFIDTKKMVLDRDLFGKALSELLAIARRYPGMFDPFVLHNGKLWTRDSESSRWIKASNSKDLTSAGRQGIPLTLFDRNFTQMAHAALSETRTADIREWISKVEKSRKATVIFEGVEIPARMLEEFTPMEIAMILGGH